jgi:hypothetical protein
VVHCFLHCKRPNWNAVSTVIVHLHHHKNHQPYYDVALLPPDASTLIHKNLKWGMPVSTTPKIQALYLQVTLKQVHRAWTEMSKTLWKRDKMQLPSTTLLLEQFPDNVEVFDTKANVGVEQLAWGLKKILAGLKGKVVEIGVDATCEYPAEYDNAGFPLSYCLLSTAMALHVHKRWKALNAWAKCLWEKCHPEVHTH